jgi:NAD(P)H-nitrite reductase large subunit
MADRYVIVGNGAAGLTAAQEIRARDPVAEVTIITDEPFPFYSRPGLAYYLRGDIPQKQLFSVPHDYYRQHKFRLLNKPAIRLDTDARTVSLADDLILPYDRLLIATGSCSVKPRLPGIELPGVVTLDTMADAQGILRLAKKAKRAVVVGGGITALELAEGLQDRGVETHYLLRKDRFWSGLLDEGESRLVEDRLRDRGVGVHKREEVAEILGRKGRVHAVRTKSGDVLRCEIAGVAIGVCPNLDLIAGTTIAHDRGILVDDHLRTNVPGVYAAGDVAQILDRWTGEHRLDVLWPTAIASGKVAGANMAGGHKHYRKGVPFNAALLFGLHLTAIGQVSARPVAGDNADLVALSRGASEVWFSRGNGECLTVLYKQAAETKRVVIRGRTIVGALLLGGGQTLADPLRDLIEAEVDITPIRQRLLQDHHVSPEDILLPFWESWKAANRLNERRRA